MLVSRLLLCILLVAPLRAASLHGEPVGGTTERLDPAERMVVIGEISDALVRAYVDPARAEELARFVRERAAAGDYDTVTDAAAFAEVLTRALRGASRDEHLTVRWSSRPAVRLGDAGRQQRRYEAYMRTARDENFGFAEVGVLPGAVGYMDLRSFYPPEIAGETAVAAMRMVSSADALILDLRENGGGSGEMVMLLMSYFFTDRTELTGVQRRGEPRVHQSWTQPYVPGPRLERAAPVFVLVGPRTFSAAEAMAYDLQSLGRAIVVGERTRGGANPGEVVELSGGFSLFVPTGRTVSPVTGRNWDGTGVAPDLPVPAGAALDAALREIWTRLKDAATDPARADLFRRLLAGGPGTSASAP
jgi:retinol-binding protein 3